MKEANACGLHCTKINNISVNISGQEILKMLVFTSIVDN